MNGPAMTSRLATLRSQLASLRRARAGVRAATAWSAVGIAAVWALAALFLIDVWFQLPVPQRLVVMLLAAGGVGWAFWRFTRPLIGHSETDIDMALLVERQQEIDSDLVAAIQFEEPEAARWGSPQLESAVIDYVASVGRGINVFEGFSREQMWRRGGLLTLSLLAVVIAAIVAPAYVSAFANRLLLGSMHYPTDTRIEKIVINENPVLDFEGGETLGQSGMRPAGLKAAQGRPLKFCVLAAGDLPASGTVRVRSTGPARNRTSFELKRLTDGEARQVWLGYFGRGMDQIGGTVFSGELPRLLEGVSYQVYLGDAWTDPATIQMVPLPIVETQLIPVFPRYAQTGRDSFDPTGRQVAVLEGTSIKLAIESKNKKRLQSAWMTVKVGDETQRHELVQQGADGLRWSLAEEKSPLTNIRQELRYEIQVIDEDGLSLEAPLRGTIRIRPDRPPSGLADVVHKVVLPTAEPLIEYRATDDYGVATLALVVEVERHAVVPSATRPQPIAQAGSGGSAVAPAGEPAESSTPDMTPAAAVPVEDHRYDLIGVKEPLVGDRLPVQGKFALSLSPLKLVKGDQIKITLEVTDYRGENDAGQPVGVVYRSDPLVLEISDESGVLAAISEADQRSEERLTDIIKRQLGIGESP
jgi:hypothetical protein